MRPLGEFGVIGVPLCRICRRLIWPWQDFMGIEVSANATEPPVALYEPFHKPCGKRLQQEVRIAGGVVYEL